MRYHRFSSLFHHDIDLSSLLLPPYLIENIDIFLLKPPSNLFMENSVISSDENLHYYSLLVFSDLDLSSVDWLGQ